MVERRGALAARRAAMGFTQETFAARLGVEASTVGRWERGTLMPQPWRRQRIAKELDVSMEHLEQLLRGDTGRPENSGRPAVQEQPEAAVIAADARDAADFARAIAENTVTAETLDEIAEHVRSLASEYVSRPPVELFVKIRQLRNAVFPLLQGNRFPPQMRELYLLASRVAGLQAHLCLDLGRYQPAHVHARTALLCTDFAGHKGMRAWVRGVQSLISYWEGRLDDAVVFARDGARHQVHGSVMARLPSLEARACAARGDVAGVWDALDRADQARGRVDGEDDAGVFTFPQAKQKVYAGTTLLTLGDQRSAAQAQRESWDALRQYEAKPTRNRSSGDMLAARLDLATAGLIRGDLEACREQVETVVAVPPARRAASIVKRAVDLGHRLDQSPCADAVEAPQLRQALSAFCSSTWSSSNASTVESV